MSRQPVWNNEKGYFFERKLKGGYISELNAYVTEAVVRKIGLEQGDYVKTTEVSSEENTPTRYFYEILQKGKKNETERSEIKCGLVERDGNLLLVKKTLLNGGEPIRLNDAPYSFLTYLARSLLPQTGNAC